MKPLQWFTDRIGKRIFRNSNGCSCEICKRIEANGLIIDDDFHASYIYDWYLMGNKDGTPLEYADTKEELE